MERKRAVRRCGGVVLVVWCCGVGHATEGCLTSAAAIFPSSSSSSFTDTWKWQSENPDGYR